MDFKYRISVIIPIYNVEEYLEACLESLVKQSIDKKDLEVLLINDGSPDNSEAICKKFCEKYDFFKYFSKENEGLSKTRNFGIQHAQGKYFVFLDPDDELTEKSLKNLALEEEPLQRVRGIINEYARYHLDLGELKSEVFLTKE